MTQGLDPGSGGQNFLNIKIPAGHGIEKLYQRLIAEKHQRHQTNSGAATHLQVV